LPFEGIFRRNCELELEENIQVQKTVVRAPILR